MNLKKTRIEEGKAVPMVIMLANDRITLEGFIIHNGEEPGEYVIYNIDKRIVQ